MIQKIWIAEESIFSSPTGFAYEFELANPLANDIGIIERSYDNNVGVGETKTFVQRVRSATGLAITNIEGLGPGELTLSKNESTLYDGGAITYTRYPIRNITMEIRYLYGPTTSIEDARRLSYRVFETKKILTIGIVFDRKSSTDLPQVYFIQGIVEKNEPVIFSDKSGCDISILCPDPFFYTDLSFDTSIAGFGGSVDNFIIPEKTSTGGGYYTIESEGAYKTTITNTKHSTSYNLYDYTYYHGKRIEDIGGVGNVVTGLTFDIDANGLLTMSGTTTGGLFISPTLFTHPAATSDPRITQQPAFSRGDPDTNIRLPVRRSNIADPLSFDNIMLLFAGLCMENNPAFSSCYFESYHYQYDESTGEYDITITSSQNETEDPTNVIRDGYFANMYASDIDSSYSPLIGIRFHAIINPGTYDKVPVKLYLISVPYMYRDLAIDLLRGGISSEYWMANERALHVPNASATSDTPEDNTPTVGDGVNLLHYSQSLFDGYNDSNTDGIVYTVNNDGSISITNNKELDDYDYDIDASNAIVINDISSVGLKPGDSLVYSEPDSNPWATFTDTNGDTWTGLSLRLYLEFVKSQGIDSAVDQNGKRTDLMTHGDSCVIPDYTIGMIMRFRIWIPKLKFSELVCAANGLKMTLLNPMLEKGTIPSSTWHPPASAVATVSEFSLLSSSEQVGLPVGILNDVSKFIVENASDNDVGVIIKIKALDSISDVIHIVKYSRDGDIIQDMGLDLSKIDNGNGLSYGDELHISTKRGKKYIEIIYSDGTVQSKISVLKKNSDWIVLSPKTNTFGVTSETSGSDVSSSAKITFEYKAIYGGV